MTFDLVSLELWGTLAAAAGAITAVWAALRKIVPVLRKLGHLADDLIGEPARPGVEARPGVMERMASMERQLAVVQHEVEHNEGTSLKDATRRTEEAVAALTEQVDMLTARDQAPPVVQQDITIRPNTSNPTEGETDV